MILLNGFNGSINIDETYRSLSGTFLIKFNSSTVKVNNRTFSNLEASPLQMIPALLQPTPFEIDHINLLSLEALNELQINNTETISTIQKHLQIGSFSISTILFLVFILIACLSFYFKSTGKIVIWKPQIPFTIDESTQNPICLQNISDPQNLRELVAPVKPPRLHNIPFF